MTYSVVTTFPNDAWNVYAKEMVKSVIQHWDPSVAFFICLEENGDYQQIAKEIGEIHKEFGGNVGRSINIAVGYDDYQREFMERNANFVNTMGDYRGEYVRFSHKVFSLAKAADALSNDETLIWLDADDITNNPITIDVLNDWCRESITYLGRKD